MYLLRLWLMPWFFLSFASELVVLLPELGERVGSLERETLAKSLEERHALEGELDQIRNVA